MVMATESMSAQNGEIESLRHGERAGIGVRALIGSSWGFASTAELSSREARRAGQHAAETARASARLAGAPLEMAPVPAVHDHWESACAEDPLSVPLSEKAGLLASVTSVARAAGAQIAQASYDIWDTTKWLATSEGSRISQHIRECGAAMSATAIGAAATRASGASTAPGDGSSSASSTFPVMPGGSGRKRWPCCPPRSAPIGAATWYWAPSKWRCKFTSP